MVATSSWARRRDKSSNSARSWDPVAPRILRSKGPSTAMSAIRRSASGPKPSRRDFLGLVTSTMLTASGVLAAGGLVRFLDYASAPPRKTQFDLGPASAYAVGSRTILP